LRFEGIDDGIPHETSEVEALAGRRAIDTVSDSRAGGIGELRI